MLKYEVIRDNANLMYRRYGKYHRLAGPAAMCASTAYYWEQYGQKHREDGPAYIGYYHPRYFILGSQYTVEEYELKIRSR